MRQGFSHLESGTPEHEWAGSIREMQPLAGPRSDDRLLVVSAHPDDETLGAGGLIANAARVGASVTVVVATDGEASHPQSTTRTPEQLAVVRRVEVLAAVSVLAPDAEVRFLGRPDGALLDDVDALSNDVERYAVGQTHVVSPWRGDRHPDHTACAIAAARAATRKGELAHWQYPIWAWHWARPGTADLPWRAAARLELTPDDIRAKRAALRCHVSQHSPLSDAPGDEAILAPPFLMHFQRASETFFVEPPQPAATSTEYFDTLYRRSNDPWGLRTRYYEQRKRRIVLASLPRPRFGRVFEPGCALGLLTRHLAARSELVVAWDTADAAIRQARRTLRSVDNVVIKRGHIPEQWPTGSFELIVLSEIGYYCPDPQVLSRRIEESLAADGLLVSCHWRHKATDHPHKAEDVHQALGRGLHEVVRHIEADFLLQVWCRSANSVAQREGILP
jgi:LmbE family N-acetylglucosaminyl deacetylase/SAM-dependent methyltransferase